ncbi:unnamed protein product, partial [Mesorhabditis belari]|uniref:CHK kinase-like domain-containing protein n=1 Tax=Mesorhabditis belari TaxID=2138241 RepID=A0AAF3JBR1_9BILA
MYNEELGAGYILLEFIEKLSLCHVYHNLQEKPLIEIIGHLAEIAIRGLKLEKKIEKIEQKNAWDVILKDIAELTVTEKRFIDMKVVFPDQSTQIDYILQKFPSIFADFQKFQDLRMTNSPIQLLCHGDLWTTNILFTKDEKGEFQVKALIDWQLFHIGSPVEDLVFLLYSALGPNEIKRTNFYLQVYYDLIKNAVGEEKCPWGEINELIKQYEISYIHMISIIHPMNVNGFEDQIIACDENEIDWCRENFGLKSAAITAELCRCFEKWIQ